MDKPVCKVNGRLGPNSMCGAVSIPGGDAPSRCHSKKPEMCDHSSVYNEALIPKPCPFCEYHYGLYVAQDEVNWVVGCDECGLKLDRGFGTKEEAVAAWNNRND